MSDREIRAAPNYTVPALVMGAVNLICLFFVTWALWGLAVPLLLAVALNHAISRLAEARRRR